MDIDSIQAPALARPRDLAGYTHALASTQDPDYLNSVRMYYAPL